MGQLPAGFRTGPCEPRKKYDVNVYRPSPGGAGESWNFALTACYCIERFFLRCRDRWGLIFFISTRTHTHTCAVAASDTDTAKVYALWPATCIRRCHQNVLGRKKTTVSHPWSIDCTRTVRCTQHTCYIRLWTSRNDRVPSVNDNAGCTRPTEIFCNIVIVFYFTYYHRTTGDVRAKPSSLTPEPGDVVDALIDTRKRPKRKFVFEISENTGTPWK